MGSFLTKAKSSSTFCYLWLPTPTLPTANRHNLCNPTHVSLVIGALLVQQGPNFRNWKYYLLQACVRTCLAIASPIVVHHQLTLPTHQPPWPLRAHDTGSVEKWCHVQVTVLSVLVVRVTKR